MSTERPTMRALLIGIERYPTQEIPTRPGTLQALREMNHRLGFGGWSTRLLTDDASSSAQRAGLTQILEGFAWMSQGNQGLIVISTHLQDERLYPQDYKPQFVTQSTLALSDLFCEISSQVGLILDGGASRGLTEHLDWSLIASSENTPPELFGTYGPTQFLHSVVVALNTWPQDKELKVKAFFDHYRDQGAPPSVYYNYSSLESVSLLTPIPERVTSSIQLPDTDPSGIISSAHHSSFNDFDATTGSAESSEGSRGGRFLDRGRFQLLRLLGEGGIGQVFLARDVHLKEERAIKLLKIPDQLSDTQRDHIRGRMMQSVRAAQKLSTYTHHVVQVYDIGVDEETEMPFVVMEHLKGITLNERLRQQPPLSLDEIFEISLTLCETLAIAHEQGIIHRDLKPENVMLIQRDDQERFVKLLDFDLVKMNSSDVKTQEGQILGTLEYMSPEQLKGLEVDARADVFSLGAILYECFSGVRANSGKNQRQLVRTLLDRGVSPLNSVAPDLPISLCTLIDRTLSLIIDDRPTDARALLRDLRPLQTLKPALSKINYLDRSDQLFDLPTTSLPLPNDPAPPLISAPPHLHSPHLHSPHLHSPHNPQASLDSLISSESSELQGSSTSFMSSTLPPRTHEWKLSITTSLVMLTLGILITLYVFKVDHSTTPSTTPEPPHENLLTTEQINNLLPLQPLDHPPLPSDRWDSVESTSSSHQSHGDLRIYQGGTTESRLARLIHELFLGWKRGDQELSEWRVHPQLRWMLLDQVAPEDMYQRPGQLLMTQQRYYAYREGSRHPKRTHQELMGDVLTFPQGLLLLNLYRNKCKALKSGDLITQITWNIPGYKSPTSCQKTECVQHYQKAIKSMGRQMKLFLNIELKRPQIHQGQWTKESIRVRCNLKKSQIK